MLALSALCLCGSSPQLLAQVRTPQSLVSELLDADRAFSTASARTDLISGLLPMLADDGVMLLAGRTIAGKPGIAAALQATADNARSRQTWTPLSGVVSADGLHGFTFGVLTLEQPDMTKVPLKYLSYWVKGASGWRVMAYKRGRAGAGSATADPYQFTLPAALVAPTSDTALLKRHEESLAASERAFSDEAQKIGLGNAFAQFGRPDAVNMGGPSLAGFIVGADAIARAVGEGAPPTGSPVSWWPDRVIVASSGDLGVTIGLIHRNAEVPAGQPADVPFFTVWRRATVNEPWRYIAE